MKTTKVVLHVSDINQINRMKSNINNLFKEDQNLIISVVINGEAVTKFINGNDIEINTNVNYYVCNNSLEANKINKKDILKDVFITPSDVHKLILLQQEGYNYIKV